MATTLPAIPSPSADGAVPARLQGERSSGALQRRSMGLATDLPDAGSVHASPMGSPKTPSRHSRHNMGIRFSPNVGGTGSTSPVPYRRSETGLAPSRQGSTVGRAKDRMERISRASSSGLVLLSTEQGDGDKSEQEDRATSGSVKLPDLVAASRRAMPRVKSARSMSGFIQRSDLVSKDRPGAATDDEDEEPVKRTQPGPGGMPVKHDKKYYQPREEDVLYIASNMGMVRKELGDQQLKAAVVPKVKVASTMTVNQVSPLGIQLSVLTRFADSIHSELSTAEVVAKYVAPQTSQLRCRFVDLVSERATDTPGYYVMHCWSMRFRTLVRALREHFELQKIPENEAVIWIDFYCVNQHRPVAAPEMSSIADVMKGAGKVLFVLDRHGVALGRTWIMWELWQLAAADRQAAAQGAMSAAGARLIVLPVSWAWDDMYHSFITMDVSKSAATHERERGLLLTDMLGDGDAMKVTELLQETLRMGAKRDLMRASKTASINARRCISAANTYAMLLYQSTRYIEAEDVMKTIKALFDKMGHRDLNPQDEASYMLHMAQIQKEKGVPQEAQRILIDFDAQCKDLNDELYLAGEYELVDMHCMLKSYTKAEMLCRKNIELWEKLYGRNNFGMVKHMLQMASISAAQKLYEEAEDHTLTAMKLAHQLEGPDGLTAASCYHMLSICYYYTSRQEEVRPLLDRALRIRQTLLGKDHPVTLESQSLYAMMLVQGRRLQEAETLMNQILRSRIRSYGPDHHDTLETMGGIADLLHVVNKDDEALALEKRMIEIGKELLASPRINRFRSLRFIANYLVKRDHLTEKAALFLAKAYIVYKEKLGSDGNLTLHTKGQLSDIIAQTHSQGMQALNQGELFGDKAHFCIAEDALKQAWNLSRLVRPEDDHREIAQGLADALFAQEKVQEAKSVMRTAGLVKKGMQQNMPASYLRWLNKRVAQYMDKKGDAMEGR